MTVNPAIQKVVDVATGQVGYHEGKSGGSWNNQEKYAGQVPGLEWANGQPWCAVFVSWVALEADVSSIFPRTASCDAAAAWFKDRHQWSDVPQVGDQVFYGSTADLVHTGVVVAFDPVTITTVEGNTNDDGSREGDGVYRKVRRRRDAYVVGYGQPAYDEAPKPERKPNRVEQARTLLEAAVKKAQGDRADQIRAALRKLPER